MNTNGMKAIAELLGASEEQVKRIEELSFNLHQDPKENIVADLTHGTIEERQNGLIPLMKQTLKSFENCDVVECDNELLNDEMVEIMWKNINVYVYDVETFFLNKCEFNLNKDGKLLYKMFFSIEDNNIFLYVQDNEGDTFVCGAIIIREGRFIPFGAVDDEYYQALSKQHMHQNIPFDREFIANRTLLNAMLYILLVNQMVNQNKEVITETSSRVNVNTKKKSKSTKKKTTNVRYIKVDSIKVKKVRDDYERETRESYNRHVAEWNRRGYWTTLRNGKRHFVKPTVCHAKDKVGTKINKIYKIK